MKLRCLGISLEISTDPIFATVTRGEKATRYLNLVEAWTIFIQTVDQLGRRRIGKFLEERGYNPHTGGPLCPSAPPSPPKEDPTVACEDCVRKNTCPKHASGSEQCINGIRIPGKEESA